MFYNVYKMPDGTQFVGLSTSSREDAEYTASVAAPATRIGLIRVVAVNPAFDLKVTVRL